MDLLTGIGLIGAFCTTFSYVPQAVKTIKTRDTKGISFWMYVMAEVGFGFWLAYGIILHSLPLIGANIISLILGAIILHLKLKHG